MLSLAPHLESVQCYDIVVLVLYFRNSVVIVIGSHVHTLGVLFDWQELPELGDSALGRCSKVNSGNCCGRTSYRPDALPVTQPTASKHRRMHCFGSQFPVNHILQISHASP